MSTDLMKRTAVLCGGVCLLLSSVVPAAEINIYSYRQPFLIKPILDSFEAVSGIQVNVVYVRKGLVKRLEIEGDRSVVDLILTADIGPLYALKQARLIQPVKSDVLKENIPAKYRDADSQWFGLTARSRILYTSKERLAADAIGRYEELADSRWKGRVCSRSGKHKYMLSLVSSLILANGETATEQWLRDVKDNLARRPTGNDRAQIKAISDGVCDVALANSYYFGKILTNERKPEQQVWAGAVRLVFPNQADRGAHMNISGIALSRYAPHREEAIRLMEYLSAEQAQFMYAQGNFEFPVRVNTPRAELIETYMGDFKEDDQPLGQIAARRQQALQLVEKVGYDE
ncbi:extracellular solute-binding protein [Aliamphritea hakodatensis]|uniref:extracellular solute-binding protein n=1 Tax=Aliamphritea hakodatensis TaxID=2895352 RepID=UPI0022FD7628|nr:extracellular solute-binding protein [Aliamphritea hakodatensis]